MIDLESKVLDRLEAVTFIDVESIKFFLNSSSFRL